ncbi:MAG: TetR/AcrR family transcriptional regulator [Ardenticatenaceae bacterium]|nr:TetR/AcrR family transcriptional regulator [Anaerolineales bacterium]MCB8923270.1 TetR/AcrR family transcriptional regulator [Ardenticatenaceae bacterium]
MTEPIPSPNKNNTRTRIMQAATQLFAETGYAGTTTRAIAELAGFNELTLFRHFGSKENLVKAIVDEFGGLAIAEDLESRLSGNYIQDLTLIGNELITVLAERNHVVRMAICEAGRFPEIRQSIAENPRQIQHFLTNYFAKRIEENLIQPDQPEVLAQAFLGMFFFSTVIQGFLLGSSDPDVTSEEIVKQFVAIFVRGTLK